MRKTKGFWPATIFLTAVHLLVLGAGFFAPYETSAQNRRVPLAPPTKVHFFDAQGRFHLRPFVYAWVPRAGAPDSYQEDRAQAFPVRFFVRGDEGTIAGLLSTRTHLFGVDAPGRIHLFGTDEYGRDQFSRFVYGGQISLLAGMLAAGLALGLGILLGTTAGFHGGRVDAALMRTAELFLSSPWLYLLFAVRAFLPLRIGPAEAFLILVGVIGLIGWARPARLIRGVVLSARERNFVLSARAFGAANRYLLRRHILPQTLGVILTQAALLIPQFILAEVTLSFLGLGVGEPVPSWGHMLGSLQQFSVLTSHWWMFFPGLVLIPIFLSYQFLANTLQERWTLGHT